MSATASQVFDDVWFLSEVRNPDVAGGEVFDVFVNAVTDSLHPVPPWASCEWATPEVIAAE